MTLPELRLADWRATKDTLHLYSQIIGKIRLATTAPRNHWWNVPLYVDVRGLTTRRLHHRDTTFEITIDFVLALLPTPASPAGAAFCVSTHLTCPAPHGAAARGIPDPSLASPNHRQQIGADGLDLCGSSAIG